MSAVTRRRFTGLSAAAFVAVMLVAPAASAETSSTQDDPIVTPPPVTVTVLGRSVYLFPEDEDVPEPDTTIGVNVGDIPAGVEYTSDEDDPASDEQDAAFAAACDVARQGDPVTYCETNP